MIYLFLSDVLVVIDGSFELPIKKDMEFVVVFLKCRVFLEIGLDILLAQQGSQLPEVVLLHQVE